jgi:hypothetical protein
MIHRVPKGLTGTNEQVLAYLNTHWGREYSFAAPSAPGGRWSAVAKFGENHRIEEWSAGELLEEARSHYHANKPGGHGDDGQ